METLFFAIPICVGLGFLLVIGIFVYAGVSAFTRWSRNNAQPVLASPAHVVAKRTEVSGWNSSTSRGRTSTYYYVTFELESGSRLEFWVEGEEFGLLVEGDHGVLTHQGTRYLGFQRHSSENAVRRA